MFSYILLRLLRSRNEDIFIYFPACDCPKASGPNTAELTCDATGECICPDGFNLNSKGQCLAASKLLTVYC